MPQDVTESLKALVAELLERPSATRHVALLLDATHMVASETELTRALRNIITVATDVTAAAGGAIAVIAPDGLLEQFVQLGLPDAEVETIEDLPRGPAVAITPVARAGASYGSLFLVGGTADPVVGHLAGLAATLIANARQYEEARLAQRWVAASEEINRRLLSGELAESDVTFIAGLVIELAGAAFVGLVLPDATAWTVQFGPLSYNSTLLRDKPFLALPTVVSRTLSTDLDARSVHAIEAAASAEVSGFGPLMIIPWGETGAAPSGAFVVARGSGGHQFSSAEREMAERFVRSVSIARELAGARNDRERIALADERDRIARDLHDHVIQSLFAVGLGLQSVVGQASGQVQARVSAQIDAIDVTIRQIRQTIFQLNSVPSTLAYSQKQQLNQLVRTTLDGEGIDSSLDFTGPVDTLIGSDLGDEVSAVVREGLSNVVRHAHASRVDISVAVSSTGVRVVITDNGRGLGELRRRSGLSNLAARAKELGGTFTIAARAPSGTTLDWEVPVR